MIFVTGQLEGVGTEGGRHVSWSSFSKSLILRSHSPNNRGWMVLVFPGMTKVSPPLDWRLRIDSSTKYSKNVFNRIDPKFLLFQTPFRIHDYKITPYFVAPSSLFPFICNSVHPDLSFMVHHAISQLESNSKERVPKISPICFDGKKSYVVGPFPFPVTTIEGG